MKHQTGANALTVDCHAMTRTTWTEAGATWNKYDGVNNWTAAGGDYSATIVDSLTFAGSETAGTEAAFVLLGTGATNAMSITWGDTVSLLLKPASGTSLDRWCSLASKEHATSSYRPTLRVTYLTSDANIGAEVTTTTTVGDDKV